MKKIVIGDICLSNDAPLALMAGPCALESENHALMLAAAIAEKAARYDIPFIFKGSFDKANRTSIHSARGVGLEEGMGILRAVRDKFSCPVMTDIHDASQCEAVAQSVDILQIPAFLCRQTDLLVAAGKTNKVINIKKGQFMAPWTMTHSAQKIAETGNDNILLTERGVSFGYNRLVSDLCSLPILAQTGYPVIFDATHSVQEPSSQDGTSGGAREFIAPLARAAVAVGCACLFVEVHEDPNRAPSDGATMLPLDQLDGLLEQIHGIDTFIKGTKGH